MDKKLFYERRNGNGEEVCDVSEERWRDIVVACDEMDIWSLPPDLSNLDIIDCLLYYFKLKCGRRMLQSQGQLSRCPDWTAETTTVHRMLQDLAGWKPAS